MSYSVAIIDYKMGNLFSVERACQKMGLDAKITSNKNEILEADAAILPGVGAFGEAMANLEKLDLISTINEFINSKKSFLGICLGMHLLMSESAEFGNHKGLDIIKGRVVRFPSSFDSKKLLVPLVGWAEIFPSRPARWDGTILKNVQVGEFMYFVHSFYVEPFDKKDAMSITTYQGLEYCSSICRDNVIATQFHPEKSGSNGLEIYAQFKKMIGEQSGH